MNSLTENSAAGQAQKIDYPEPSAAGTTPPAGPVLKTLNPIHSVKARLSVRVGEIELTVGDLMRATASQVFAMDRTVDQPVDLLLEGSVVARGELVAVDDHFGIRITELPVDLKATL